MSGPLVDHSKWPIIIPCFEVKGSLLNCQKDIERQYLRSFAHRKKKHCVLPFPGAKGALSRLVSCPKPKMWPFFPRPSAECSWWLELRDRVSKTHAGSLAKQCRLLQEPLEWPSIFRFVYVLDVCLEPIRITTDVLVKNEQLNTAKIKIKNEILYFNQDSFVPSRDCESWTSLDKKTAPHCLVIYRARATMQKEVGFQDTWRSAIRMFSFTTWLCFPLSITHGVYHHDFLFAPLKRP